MRVVHPSLLLLREPCVPIHFSHFSFIFCLFFSFIFYLALPKRDFLVTRLGPSLYLLALPPLHRLALRLEAPLQCRVDLVPSPGAFPSRPSRPPHPSYFLRQGQ